LLFILIFGLFLGNLDGMKSFSLIERLRPEKLHKEVLKFRDITSEATFMIRGLFFMLFGFLMQLEEILNVESLPWAAAIVFGIIFIRWIVLKIAGLPVSPILFVAPRGLITILLFISILPEHSIPIVNKSLIIQTIIISVLAMMYGIMTTGNKKTDLHL
jgi:cell volume regulation protein A